MLKTAAPMTGLSVNYFECCCGSFRVSGYKGTTDDKMTRAYLYSMGADGKYPDRIEMALDVAEFYFRVLGTLSWRPMPHDSTAEEIVAHVTKLILNDFTQIRPGGAMRFMSATVTWNRDLPPGVMVFYSGDEPVAELSGWVA